MNWTIIIIEAIFFSKTVLIKKGCALLLVLLLMLGLMKLAGTYDFWSAFALS